MKKFLTLLMMMVILSGTLLTQAPVLAGPGGSVEHSAGNRLLIGSNGFVTPTQHGTRNCTYLEDFTNDMDKKLEESREKMATFSPEETGLTNIPGMLTNGMLNVGFGLIDSLTYAATQTGMGNCAAEGEQAKGFLSTIFSQTQIFTQYSSITYIGGLMNFIGIGQWFAIMMMMFFILFKGYQAFRGKQIDPIGLILRFMATMFIIYLTPYLLQDILNMNNLLTHYISGMTLQLNGHTMKIAEVLPASIMIMLSDMYIIMASSVAELTQSVDDAGNEGIAVVTGAFNGLGTMLLMLVAMVVILLMVMIPFFKLVLWWYIRFFKIFIMAAIAPFMFLTFSDEETEGVGYNFIKNFAVTAFEQFFMVIGVALTGVFIANIIPLMSTMNLGIIGFGIALYAAFSFLATLPEVIGEWFRGGGSGSRMNPGQMAQGMGSVLPSKKRSESNGGNKDKSSGGGGPRTGKTVAKGMAKGVMKGGKRIAKSTAGK